MVDFQDFFGLTGSPGKHMAVGVGGSTIHVTRMGKQILGRPQQFNARFLLHFFKKIGHGI
jgi:hypothetical protein